MILYPSTYLFWNYFVDVDWYPVVCGVVIAIAVSIFIINMYKLTRGKK